MIPEILIVVVLVLLNGVFSGAEIALLALRRTRIGELVEEGRFGARAVAALRADPEALLATVQVGITVVGAAAAAFGGSSIAAELGEGLRPLLGERADGVAFVLVVAGISYLSLVLGELVPKSLALRTAEGYALVVAPPLAALAQGARPLVWLLTSSSNLVLRLFGDRTSFSESRLSAEELRQLIDEAATAGTVQPEVGEIAARALEFHELDVSAVMVPAGDITCLRRDAPVADLAELARTRGHARVIVHDGGMDQVVGYVVVREVLARAHAEPTFAVADAIHPVPYVPDTLPAPRALRDLQHRRVPFALVVDEQGTVRGLVTIEDLVEELVGEILSEGDLPVENLRREADGAVWMRASTPLHEVDRALGTALAESGSASTVGGLVLSLAGKIPAPGARWQVDDWEVEVADATQRRVKAVRLRPRRS